MCNGFSLLLLNKYRKFIGKMENDLQQNDSTLIFSCIRIYSKLIFNFYESVLPNQRNYKIKLIKLKDDTKDRWEDRVEMFLFNSCFFVVVCVVIRKTSRTFETFEHSEHS